MNYPNVDIFNNSPIILNRKTSKAIQIWIMFLIFGAIIFFIIGNYYKFSLFTNHIAYVKKIDSKYYVVTYLEEDEIRKLYYSEILIEKEKFDFKVVTISEEVYSVNNIKCYEVVLDMKLKEMWLVENNILNIVLKKEETTILKEIKKGINLWKS